MGYSWRWNSRINEMGWSPALLNQYIFITHLIKKPEGSENEKISVKFFNRNDSFNFGHS